MKRPFFSLLFIILLTLFCLIINFSQPFSFSFGPIKQSFSGINLSSVLSFLHVPQGFPLRRGLDLAGGTSVTLRAQMQDIPESQREAALESAKTVIERRVNFFGVSEPVVQTAKVGKDYRIIVEIPGVTDVNEAVKLVGQTAKLTFWESTASASAPLTLDESIKIATQSSMPLGIIQLLGRDAKQTELSGDDLKGVAVTFDANNGNPQVALTFTGDGAKKFGKITARNIGKILAIVIDDQVVEAPRVNEAIYGGSAVITGQFTTDQAKVLQVQLNAGALPVSFSVLEQRAVGASLGEASIQKSFIAGMIGFFVIVLFMITQYGRLGFIASLALFVYALSILTLFRLIPVTLTLAGIAGFILSIGIAVDANILIFERMKEEMRLGKSRRMAIDVGFQRAWLSIRDSNIASLITSAVLYYFGTGIIRGFALTLAIGVLVSMFSAIFVTRTLLRVFYKK